VSAEKKEREKDLLKGIGARSEERSHERSCRWEGVYGEVYNINSSA